MTEIDPRPAPTRQDDILWRHLKTLPAFRALLRAVEARFYHQVELPEPLLDLGCGDGNFVELTFNGRQLGVGLDPWWNPLRKAKKAAIYALPLQGLGHNMPFPDGHFASAISNSVLEHIPDIQPVLNETSRVMKIGGRFVMTMPNHRFTECLGGAQLLERTGQSGLADRYRDFFNFISRHAHTESIEWWAERLAQAGFTVERWQYYFSEKALHTLELGHAQGLPSAALHTLTGQWVLAPVEFSLAPTERWVRPFFEEEADGEGTYLLIIARKVANHPIVVNIPEAQPFTQEELARGEATMFAPDPASLEIEEEIAATAADEPAYLASARRVPEPLTITTTPTPREKRPLSPLGVGLYLFGILLPAIFGQSILNADPQAAGRGFFWYGVSFVVLLLFGWSQSSGRSLPRFRLPTVQDLSGPVGFYVGGLILSWLAFRFVSTPGSERPTIAVALWLLAIIMAGYGFWPLAEMWPLAIKKRETWLIAGVLLLIGLLIRALGLTSHPFIINGTEANIGREAMLVSDGFLGNPFGTSWLTNPSLPLYLIGLPLRIFGRTALAVRFWSPVMGALTVAAIYLIGQKLWNRYVGITAALLLAGSHWHIHYSRLGMTNIWDPLATLVTFGLLLLAWRAQKRILWILTGVALGLNAYLYTSSHLVPLILLAFLGLQLLTNWAELRANGRSILIALLVAFVVALPLLLYYNANPTIFMERANQYGIFQTGWLAQQTQQTGESSAAVLWQQMKLSLLAFNATADASNYYGVDQPLLGFWAAIAFIFGTGVALYHFRQPRYQLLIVWVGVTAVFAGGLLIESPASHRLLIAAPAVMLLAGIALHQLGQLLYNSFVRTAAPAADRATTADEGFVSVAQSTTNGRYQTYRFVALALLTVAMIVPDMLFYFANYRQDGNFGDLNTEIADVLGNYMREELTGREKLYFFAPPAMYVSFPTITYLGQGFTENVNLFNVDQLPSDTPVAFLPDIGSDPAVFVFIPSRFADIAAVRTRYPDGELREFAGHFSNPLFVVYEVTPEN